MGHKCASLAAPGGATSVLSSGLQFPRRGEAAASSWWLLWDFSMEGGVLWSPQVRVLEVVAGGGSGARVRS